MVRIEPFLSRLRWRNIATMKVWFLLLGTVAFATATTPFYYNDYAPRYPQIFHHNYPEVPYYNPDRIDLGDILREVMGDGGIKISTFGVQPRDSNRYDSYGNKRYNSDRIDLGDILREVVGEDLLKIATFGVTPRDSNRYDSYGNKRYNSDRMFSFGNSFYDLIRRRGLSPGTATFIPPHLIPDLFNANRIGFNYPGHVPGPLTTVKDPLKDPFFGHTTRDRSFFSEYLDLIRRGGVSPGIVSSLPDLFNTNRISFNYLGHVPGPLATVKDPLKDPFFGHTNRDRTVFPNFYPQFPFQTPPFFPA